MNAAPRFLLAFGIAVLHCLNCVAYHPGFVAPETSVRERLSLQTEFWRTNFHQSKNELLVAEDGTESSKTVVKASDSSFELLMDLMSDEQSQIMTNETTRAADDLMLTQADMTMGSAPSDWDRAAMSTVTTNSLHASGNTGPSTVTIAVAVIGMIVLAGAYLRA